MKRCTAVKVKNLLNRLIHPHTYSSDAYIRYLKKSGIAVGKDCHVFQPKTVSIDMFRPYLLSIGDNVVICAKTTILTHDYSHTVLLKKYGRNIGDAKPVSIGNNVFIGIDAMILMGTEIGNNVIIGAKSVVRGKIPDNCVVAGNPAKVICSIDRFYEKRKMYEMDCAVNNVQLSQQKIGRNPTLDEMGDAFAWLYLPHTEETIAAYPQFFQLPGKDSEEIKSQFLASESSFDSYGNFLEFVEQQSKC